VEPRPSLTESPKSGWPRTENDWLSLVESTKRTVESFCRNDLASSAVIVVDVAVRLEPFRGTDVSRTERPWVAVSWPSTIIAG
jgi:hypothetical protein